MPKKRAHYCYACLRKFKKRDLEEHGLQCPKCKIELRAVSNMKRRAQVVTRLARLRGIKTPTQKADYELYIHSQLWQTIRERVLKRDGTKCRTCYRKATQVHHLSYHPRVMAGEDDSQLMSVCRPCHKEIHQRE